MVSILSIVLIGVLNAISGVFVLALACFHTYLKITKQTTYEYVMRRYYPGRNRFDAARNRAAYEAKERRFSKRLGITNANDVVEMIQKRASTRFSCDEGSSSSSTSTIELNHVDDLSTALELEAS